MSTIDRVSDLVRAHVRALGVEAVDIGAIPQDDRRPVWHRGRTLAGVIRLIPWLRAQNARGGHIYIRCDPDSGIILLDDLMADAVDQMRTDGISPAAVVETSPGSIQAWCRLPSGAEPAIARAVCEILTRRYGGDPHAVGAGRAGRLPGFLNRKPQYRAPGDQFPWVRLLEAGGEAIPETVAGPLMEEAQGLLCREAAEPACQPAAPISTPAGVAPGLRPLLDRIRRLRPAGEGRWTGCCPAHDDAHPSLSIRIAREGPHPGAILLHCHAGCDWRSVADAAGVRVRDLFPQLREGRVV